MKERHPAYGNFISFFQLGKFEHYLSDKMWEAYRFGWDECAPRVREEQAARDRATLLRQTVKIEQLQEALDNYKAEIEYLKKLIPAGPTDPGMMA